MSRNLSLALISLLLLLSPISLSSETIPDFTTECVVMQQVVVQQSVPAVAVASLEKGTAAATLVLHRETQTFTTPTFTLPNTISIAVPQGRAPPPFHLSIAA